MRDYGKVYSRVWRNARFKRLSCQGKITYLYLLTTGHGNPVGVFPLPPIYAAADLGFLLADGKTPDITTFESAMRELTESGLALWDTATETVLICRFVSKERLDNPNTVKKCIAELRQISSGTPFYKNLLNELAHIENIPNHYEPLLDFLQTESELFLQHSHNGSGNGSENGSGNGLPNPECPQTQKPANTNTNTKPEPEPEPVPPPSGVAEPEGGAGSAPPAAPAPEAPATATAPPKAPPKPATGLVKAPKPETGLTASQATWAAYAEAYERRYGTPPVRNAMVNAQIANLVKRIGAEPAPAVAAFYVAHGNRLYVAAMHPVNLLLRDCEKVHTEWKTKTRMTDTQARQVDQTTARGAVFNKLLDEARENQRAREVEGNE